MVRLYANENFPLPAVQELRRLGHDVLTTHDAGRAGQSEADDVILRSASADGRAVLTLNRKHFIRLHSTHPEHSGIVARTFDPDFVGQAARIHEAIGSRTHLRGEVIRINGPGQ